MKVVSGIVFGIGLLLVTPTWGEEPIICEVGDYVQLRQELAQEAVKLEGTEAKPNAATLEIPQVKSDASNAELKAVALPAQLHAGTWGPPWGGFRKKLEWTGRGSPIANEESYLAGQTWGGRGTDGEYFGRSKKWA